METIVDIAAVIIFLLVVPSVVWAVRNENKAVSAALAGFVALFVTLFGIVFMSAASNLATGQSTTRIVMLAFYVVIAIFARAVWSSKPVA
jgi:hypothetical protein